MSTLPPSRRQTGQSTTEFLVALTALVPLFLAISYLGRYADLQQRATQASRYAAFARAMEPDSGRLSDADLADQMRARFFLSAKALNGGEIRKSDTAASLTDASLMPALWKDLQGKDLVENPNKVTVAWSSHAMGVGGLSDDLNAVTSFIGKSYAPARKADIEVAAFNRLNQLDDAPALLKIGASTAAAGDAMGSGGTEDTVRTISPLVPVRLIPSAVRTAMSWVISLLEDEGPEFGCIKANTVASHRLEGAPQRDSCR